MINKKYTNTYCNEDISMIENYEHAINDKTQIWDCHHRNEIMDDGTVHSVKWLKDNGLYYNRPASELIFLSHSEHTSLHNNNMSQETKIKISEAKKCQMHSEETKKKISESLKGEKHPMYGKHLSEETKKKMSEVHKGEKHHMYGKHLSEETKKKISEAQKGENHPMYGKHHSDETKQKMREIHKGEKWMTNGSVTLRVKQNDINIYLSNGYKFGRK